jgi:hypothetical protein
MRYKVELLKVRKEGSAYLKSEEYTHVLVLPRGKRLNPGDPVVGIYGVSVIESVYEKDPFDSYIYRLKEGSELVNPRKIVVTEEELDLDSVLKEKDREGPLYIEIEGNQILKEAGKVIIFR